MPISTLHILFGQEESWGFFIVDQVRHPARQAERYWQNHKHYALNIVLSGHGQLLDPQGEATPLLPGVAYQHLPGDANAGWRVEWQSQDTEEIFFLMDPSSFARFAAFSFFPQQRYFQQQDAADIVRFVRSQLEAFRKSAATLPSYVNRQAVGQCSVFLAAVFDRLESTRQAKPGDAVLTQFCSRLTADPANRKPLPQLARELGISYPMLRKQFRQIYGISLSRYRIQLRIEAARGLLSRFNVKETAEKLGYPDAFSFSAQYKQITGQSPVESRGKIDR